MKKRIALALVAIFIASFFLVRNIGSVPKGLTPQKKVVYVLENNGCLRCHGDGELPFYANLPVAKSVIAKDVRNSARFIDLRALVDDLNAGKAPSEVDVAKMEYAAKFGDMPPYAYLMAHWTDYLNSGEKAAIMEWVKSAREEFAKSTQAADEFRLEPVRPLSPAPATDPKKVALGKELFNDARLSADGTVSCATCHNLSFGGVDRLRYSKGVGGKLGGVNAPTVFNSAFQHRQFWDGRAANLEEQAGGPPVNPLEMASASWDEICKRLEADEGFKKRFLESYPEGISQKTVCAAIAEFERTLVTPNAPFDKFLKGDKSALTQEQIEGYELFKKAKCATCHAGHNLGGQSFEYMGVLRDYFKDRGGATDADKGLYNFQKDDKNLGKFKTPTLRNVALTYPYFHDGSVSSLEDAAAHMLKYQSGVKLSKGDIKKIAAFLESLTGEFEGKSLAEKGEKTAQ